MREISITTFYLYNFPFLLIFVVVAFGYKLSEHESAEITNEIEEHIKVKYENKEVLVGYNGTNGK